MNSVSILKTGTDYLYQETSSCKWIRVPDILVDHSNIFSLFTGLRLN